ncbi:beta-glucuronidase [Paenibacillus glucanolyticus]|jgi:beta-glucuronidase|uniref:glycoside hydrolase family 2 protein n=1 Tax=Paenibacillus TaxID=44249 RepID=UPI0003E21689|nr:MULTISPECIES: glycoside hydrolase family 2 TIM barrel-domain containing protein [Paenibacillus]ANA82580.1 beta-glucuronidase [Paenibacillus glucanolyticus]AVV58679.1 beta-glucuronidase [Paenibacillus glucanolyticus]ETT39807.1 beta-galactosidase [Paenibacillus sp. FSL R5-808]MPY17361.1 beta-glucuronidase [Paenibacillus glucanolyticus]
MIRLFSTHQIRKSTELEGLWDFTPAAHMGEKVGAYRYRLPVPGCWEMHPEFGNYRGIGVYRQKVTLHQRSNLRLEFKGVSHTAHVYFDGVMKACHYNAYTAFECVIPQVEAGTHDLVVYVDNSFHEDSALHVPNDYYTYGGIIRPVAVEEISDLYIQNVMFTPVRQGLGWHGSWKAVVRNMGQVERMVSIRGILAGIDAELGRSLVKSGETVEISSWVAYPDVKEWSLENPNLYALTAILTTEEGYDCDDWLDRVGFRTITTDNGKIQLNGKDVVLQGVNRHEDHPMAGSALPLHLMVRDLELITDLGCNAVRTSHYPYDERFLDLCDERGIAVWEENHARGLSLEQMLNPNFGWQSEQVTREMVQQHYNHPSILIWAILNECASHTEEGRAHYEKQLTIIGELDPSRPRSFASHHRDQEKCFDLAEIVSFNLYPGWYTDEDPGELADQARLWADALGGKGKPMIMSEFGGDGFYGFRSPNREKGSEERQADIIDSNLRAYLERDYISGIFIWQFSDCRVTEGLGWLLARSCTRNSKGIVDEYRRPKLAYETVKRYFRGR